MASVEADGQDVSDLLIQEGLDAAYEHKTVKQFLIDLARARLAEMEKKGILPKGKN